MKVKVRRRKPAPVAAEQAKLRRKSVPRRVKQAFQTMLNDKTKPLTFLTDRPISLSDIYHKNSSSSRS